MKFLVTGRSRIGPATAKPTNPERLYRSVMAWGHRALQDGTLDCTYGFAVGRGGVSIINAESHEHLLRILRSSPMFHYADYEIHPLCDQTTFWEIHIEAAQAQREPSAPTPSEHAEGS